MSHPQKNTLLQATQGNAETKACKRVFFSPTQENFFPSLPFLIKLFSQRTGFVRKQTGGASNVNHFGQIVCKLDTTYLRTERRASANMVLPQWGLTCFYETFVLKQTVVHLLNICAKNPPLRQYPNRKQQLLTNFPL